MNFQILDYSILKMHNTNMCNKPFSLTPIYILKLGSLFYFVYYVCHIEISETMAPSQ
jgi:hypothetical protein